MRPVFIGGCERSGTTLLGAMLGAPAAHVCPPEAEFKLSVLREAERSGAVSGGFVAGVLAGDSKAALQGWRPVGEGLGFPPAPAAAAMEQVVAAYAERAGRPGAEVWIDHTPHNMRWAAALDRAFAGARFVHIVRDGRAVAASLMRLEWGPNSAHRTARYWLEALTPGLVAETTLGARCLRVRFEDLVADPEATLTGLCAALDLDYDPAMARAAGFRPGAYSSEQHALVGGAPEAGRIDAWRHELSRREVEIFESVAAGQLELLGYPPEFGLLAAAPGRRERLFADAGDLYRRRVRNRWRRARRRRSQR